MEEILQAKKRQLEDLLQNEEVRGFPALSEGLKILFECDYIFLDTNVLCDGFASFDIEPNSSNLKWIKKYTKMDFYIPEFVKVYYDLQRGIITETNFKDLRSVIDDNLLFSDLKLQVLSAMFDIYSVFIPETVLHETDNLCRIVTSQLPILDRKKYIKKHKWKKPITRTSKKMRASAGYRKAVERMYAERDLKDPDLAKNFQYCISQVRDLLSLAELKDRIAANAGNYSSDHDFNDHNIIDSAMSYPGVIGIVTQDRAFIDKIPEVIQLRAERGLNVPTVVLLRPYHLFRYYNLDRFPIR